MDRDSPARIEVEVAAAWPHEQRLVSLQVAAGSCVATALTAAGFPDAQDVGIFGERVTHDRVLENGDRVEIYRPLVADPRQARRRRINRGA